MGVRTRVLELIGFVGSITAILVAIDYYFFRTGVARAVVRLPIWVIALGLGLLFLALAFLMRYVRRSVARRSGSLVPSDAGAVKKLVLSPAQGALADSTRLDLWLYTAETVTHPWRAELEKRVDPLEIRLFIRRPETDLRKHEVAEGSLDTAREIMRVNPHINLDVHFYNCDPLLRLQFYFGPTTATCLAGAYSHDREHPMRFVGAENNAMMLLTDKQDNECALLKALHSRFERQWELSAALRGVLFDLDGVLFDSMKLHYRAWRDAFEKEGAQPDEEQFRSGVYQLEGHAPEAIVTELYRKHTGRDATEKVIQRVVEWKAKSYLELSQSIKPFPGVQEVVDWLRARGVPLAVVTGTPRDAADSLLRRFFPSCFDVVITIEDIGRAKPHPDPYMAAMQKLTIRSQSGCVAIENAPLGVRSAVAAGLPVFGILLNSPLQPRDLLDAGALTVLHGVDELHAALMQVKFGDLAHRQNGST